VLTLESHRERAERFRALKRSERCALLLQAAGYRYDEIAKLTASTYTWVIWSHPVSSPPATRGRALTTCR
jgi:hypothetical protein